MITENDRQIAIYIEKVGMCTSSQIAKIFYKRENQGDSIARRRLRELVKADYLKVTKIKELGAMNIYKFNSNEWKNLTPSAHYKLLLDYLAELIYNGAIIEYFKKGQEWMDRKIKSDAFIKFDFEGKKYLQLVEIAVTNFDVDTVTKYEKLYKTNEIQDMFGEFPDIILIDDNDNSFNKLNTPLNIIKFNRSLDKFPRVFL